MKLHPAGGICHTAKHEYSSLAAQGFDTGSYKGATNKWDVNLYYAKRLPSVAVLKINPDS